MEIGASGVVVPTEISKEMLSLFAVMMDAYESDKLHSDAVRIASAVAEILPTNSIVCRVMGRALASAGQNEEAWEWYKKALKSMDTPADTAAVWYAKALDNAGHHVDSLEAYLLACWKNPNEAMNFVYAAEQMGKAQFESFTRNDLDQFRPLPPRQDGTRGLRLLVQAAFSCRSRDAQIVSRCRAAAANADVDIQDLEILLRGNAPETSTILINKLGLKERAEVARELYQALASDCTVKVSEPQTKDS